MSGGDRSRADVALLAALTGGATVEEAATAAAVSVSTVTRRLRDAGFVAQLDGYRASCLRAAADRLAVAATDAVAVLVDVATDTDTPPGARVTAASRVLDHAARLHDLTDLGARVGALEALLAPPDQEMIRP